MPTTTGTSPTKTPPQHRPAGFSYPHHRHAQRLPHRHLQRRATTWPPDGTCCTPTSSKIPPESGRHLPLGAGHHLRAGDRRSAQRTGRLPEQVVPMDREAIRCPPREPEGPHVGAASIARRRTMARVSGLDPRGRAASALPASGPQPARRHPGQRPTAPAATQRQRAGP